jgi:hypothetical protein
MCTYVTRCWRLLSHDLPATPTTRRHRRCLNESGWATPRAGTRARDRRLSTRPLGQPMETSRSRPTLARQLRRQSARCPIADRRRRQRAHVPRPPGVHRKRRLRRQLQCSATRSQNSLSPSTAMDQNSRSARRDPCHGPGAARGAKGTKSIPAVVAQCASVFMVSHGPLGSTRTCASRVTTWSRASWTRTKQPDTTRITGCRNAAGATCLCWRLCARLRARSRARAGRVYVPQVPGFEDRLLTAAEIPLDRLPDYVAAVESVATAAVQKPELAYMAVVDAVYRRLLMSGATDTKAGPAAARHQEANAVTLWMSTLADGGNRAGRRECVLYGLPPEYSNAAAAARRAAANRN